MAIGELVRAELARHDWASLRCGCGDDAEHLPLMFETILEAQTPRDMIGYTLEDHVERNGALFSCSPPAVAVILAALASGPSPLARGVLLQTLWFMSGCDLALGPPDTILADCRAAAGQGFWVLAHLGLAGDAEEAEHVADICASFGLGGERYADYQRLLRERAVAKTKRRHRR
ncbi:hypothetical protein [Streptomyces roseoviridis]|uniref:Uncharacterized protein n=1 Tax=Streptomyces roseoviridis TaxID=67361 RepID=A0ABV5QUS1_9ACTN